MDADPDRWLTPPQVAALWKVKLRTVRNWIRRGNVTVRDDGCIDGESVYEYLDGRGDRGQHHGARQVGVAQSELNDTLDQAAQL